MRAKTVLVYTVVHLCGRVEVRADRSDGTTLGLCLNAIPTAHDPQSIIDTAAHGVLCSTYRGDERIKCSPEFFGEMAEIAAIRFYSKSGVAIG